MEEHERMAEVRKKFQEMVITNQVQSQTLATDLSTAEQAKHVLDNHFEPLMDDLAEKLKIVNQFRELANDHPDVYNAYVALNMGVPSMLDNYYKTNLSDLKVILQGFIDFIGRPNTTIPYVEEA